MIGKNTGSGLAEVIAVLVRDKVHIEHLGDFGGGNRRGMQAIGSIQVEIGRDQFSLGANQPAQIAQPAQTDLILKCEELLK